MAAVGAVPSGSQSSLFAGRKDRGGAGGAAGRRRSLRPPDAGPAGGADVEVREDSEQQVKYGQVLELLLAAGYFRVRISALSPFDKVVGGMAWSITLVNVDLDVDLLFQENSTIGQKM